MSEYFTDSIFYEPLTLWLEDLDEISVLLQRQSSSFSIQIGKKIYTSYEEFKSEFKGNTIYNIRIEVSSPSISIIFSDYQNILFFYSNEADIMAPVFRIDKTLRLSERKPLLLYSAFAPSLVLAPNMILSFSMDTHLVKLAMTVFLFMSLWWMYIAWARIGRRAIIHVFDKHDQKNILKEYLPLAAALAGAIAAFILTKLF